MTVITLQPRGTTLPAWHLNVWVDFDDLPYTLGGSLSEQETAPHTDVFRLLHELKYHLSLLIGLDRILSK